MCDAQIIFGFSVKTQEQFQKVLTAKQIEDVRQEGLAICTCGTTCDCSFPDFLAVDKVTETYDKIVPAVQAINVDLENTAKYGIEGSCALVGICLNEGEGHHTGILEIPQHVGEEHNATLDAFVLKYPQFADFTRKLYVVYGKS